MSVGAFATVLIALAPHVALADCNSELAPIRKLVVGEPTTSANAAIARGDLQFLGVAGYSIAVPGVESPKCTVPRDRVRVIEGTSDTPCGTEGLQLQAAATLYAQRYNAIIRAHLDKQHVEYAACAL